MWFVLLATLFLHGSSVDEYYASAIPLRRLIEEADVIAIVEGAKSIRVIDEENDYERRLMDDEYQLKVVKILIGAAAKELTVRTSASIICPAPASFEEGKRHLVFLADSGKSYLKSYGSFYGSKQLQPEAMKVYVKAVQRKIEIEKIEKNEEQYVQTQEWLVQLCEDPITRWEGAYDLDHIDIRKWTRQDLIWKYFMECLSEEQIERLIVVLVETKKYDSAEWTLFYGLRKFDDPRLLEIALEMTLANFENQYQLTPRLQEALRRSKCYKARHMFEEHWVCGVKEEDWWLFLSSGKEEKAVVKEIVAAIREEMENGK
jgi:hypothetical protein